MLQLHRTHPSQSSAPFPSGTRKTDRQTDTCPLLQELLRAGLGLPPELPPNCPLRPLAADTLLRRYGSSRLLLSPVDISIVGQTRNFSGLQFPGPVKFLPAAYRDYHTSPPAPPELLLTSSVPLAMLLFWAPELPHFRNRKGGGTVSANHCPRSSAGWAKLITPILLEGAGARLALGPW
jgi:hypothetical protein